MNLLFMLALFVAQCACRQAQRVDMDKLMEQAKLHGERLQHDGDFVDFLFDAIERIEREDAPAAPRHIQASPALVWCTDSLICPYGYGVTWDASVGFGIHKYEQRGEALAAGCMQRHAHLKEIGLDFQCESE